MTRTKKILLAIMIPVGIILFLFFVIVAMIFLADPMGVGSGPSPKAVFVVSSKNHEIQEILDSIDRIQGELDNRVDKRLEKDAAGNIVNSRYSFYEKAYWYPHKKSNIYGVAIVKWDTKDWESGAEDMGDRFFIDVYSLDNSCALCKKVKYSLFKDGIDFFSACENPDKTTEYEKIRCDI